MKQEIIKVTIEPVKKVSSFSRKTTGKTGQQVLADNPDNDYTFRYDCVDKEDFDFSILEKGKRYVCEAVCYLRVENIRKFDGSFMYVSIPSYRLSKVLSEYVVFTMLS